MRWKPFLFAWLTIFLVWITFLLPWTKPAWDIIDIATFKTLNSTLLSTKPLQYFWALLNHKHMDLVEDGMFFLFFIWGLKVAPQDQRWRRAAQFLFCIFLAGSVIFFVNRHLLRDHVLIPRASPSLVVTPCIRISQEIPWKNVKDETLASFPGDHATTLLLFGLLYSAFVPHKLAYTTWFYIGFRILPRLILGAHWISDIAVGSLSLALFFVACFLYTPLSTFIVDIFEKIFNFGRRRTHETTVR